MAQLLQPGNYEVKHLNVAMAKWEERVRVYERRAQRDLPDDIKASVLVEMTQDPLKSHLVLNSSKLKTYEQVREEIQTFLESKQDSNSMDLGAFGTNGGKRGAKGDTGGASLSCEAGDSQEGACMISSQEEAALLLGASQVNRAAPSEPSDRGSAGATPATRRSCRCLFRLSAAARCAPRRRYRAPEMVDLYRQQEAGLRPHREMGSACSLTFHADSHSDSHSDAHSLFT